MKPELGYIFILSEKSKLVVYYQDLFNYLAIIRLYRVVVIKCKLWSVAVALARKEASAITFVTLIA